MSARTLDELKAKLIFQNSMDVWIALCREKNWDRRDYSHYRQFIRHLQEREVQLKKAPQGHPIKDSEGNPVETYTIRLDNTIIEKIRSFA
ncbi:MAG TPA: hypothetical protein VIH03_05045 [Nitrososphaerales archaeon]